MKIAIVGAGISGLGAALALAEDHDVRLFEAETRVGGHACTVEVAYPDGRQPVDIGFIVFNERNYPNLCALFDHLDVPSIWSDMSFGFSLNGGAHEYACDSLDKLFAQRWRALDPRHIAGLREIRRFQKTAPGALEAGRLNGLSLGEWLGVEGYSDWFRDRFLLPMGGAIWSTSTRAMLAFPASNFVRFFVNHDLMTGLDPAQRWRTVAGGSIQYVRRVEQGLGARIVTGRRVVAVSGGVTGDLGVGAGRASAIRFADGATEHFDAVVMACHAPQALALIRAGGVPDPAQADVLARLRTSQNRAVLHGDAALMPRRRKVWSSWNFLSEGAHADARRPAQVSYWMNRLQRIRDDRLLVVSLNPTIEPDPALVHADVSWAHPLYDEAAFEAQRLMDGVQGRGGLWYAGAWLGYGFHEDGLRAGLRVAEALGARPVWARDTGQPLVPPLTAAAE
ncbi:MAG: FAD-dependent oxidoreductase [Pseudomonadota bacterium]